MHSLRRPLLISGLAVAGLVLLAVAAFGFDRFVHRGEVLRGVSVAGVELSGLDEEQAAQALSAYEDSLSAIPAGFTVAGSKVTLDPATIGFDLDESSAVAAAMEIGRTGSTVAEFGWWLTHLWGNEAIDISATIDPDALNIVLDGWEGELITDLPFHGDVAVVDGEATARYPTSGTRIDRAASIDLVTDALLSPDRITVALPTEAAAPLLSAADIDAAVATATRMLAGSVVLTREDPELQVEFSVDELAAAFETSLILEPTVQLATGFSEQFVAAKLATLRDSLEVPPVDAYFEFGEDDTISIVPGRPGTIIDAALATEALEEAALTVSRQGQMPFEEGAQPEVTTESLEALGITGLVSEATTNHPCCQPRVENIHLFADIIDGAIVLPGEALSLNEYVGERTEERGFQPAPTIVRGKIVDTVGGGVSQFATTFYNAVFWGGYEDVTHTPHSYYFSRYPEGIEATISWPLPNLEFRNDTEAAVLIRTEYDDTSITVKFFGDNGGRQIEGTVSGRYDFTEPTTDWVANDELLPDEQNVLVEGRQGWSVTVRRTITEGNGEVSEESWVVRYKAQPWEIEVHSCVIPEGEEGYTGEECPIPPSTTTTTVPVSTTSTTPG